MAVKIHRFVGSGKCYLAPYAGGAAQRYVGDVSELAIAVDTQEVVLPNYTTPGGGNAAKIDRISGVTLSSRWHNFAAENIALAVRGTVAEVASGSVTDEAHVAYHDGLIRLDHIDPSSVVVTDDPMTVTYVADIDYVVTPGGIEILSTGSIGDGSNILVDYSYSAQRVVEALTNAALQYYLTFVGLNEAESNKPYVVDVWKFQPGFTEGLELIKVDDFGGFAIPGEALQDTNIVAAGLSQYVRWTQKEAA